MHSAQRDSEMNVGKAPQQAGAAAGPAVERSASIRRISRRRVRTRFATGPVGARLVVHLFNQDGQPTLTMHMNELRKQRRQELASFAPKAKWPTSIRTVSVLVRVSDPKNAGTYLYPL